MGILLFFLRLSKRSAQYAVLVGEASNYFLRAPLVSDNIYLHIVKHSVSGGNAYLSRKPLEVTFVN